MHSLSMIFTLFAIVVLLVFYPAGLNSDIISNKVDLKRLEPAPLPSLA